MKTFRSGRTGAFLSWFCIGPDGGFIRSLCDGKDCPDKAIIIEFKVFNPRKEKTLKDTLQTALKQIDAQQYEASLLAKGIPAERIRKYGFAFQGKTVLIG